MENVKNKVARVLDEFIVFPQDRENVTSIIENSEEKERPIIFYSLTHLKHNYITLTHLFNLAKLSKLGCDVVIALWDMNILSNPYFKKVELERYRDQTGEQYIKQKKEEVMRLATFLGIENTKIYTSSEIWLRFVQQKDPPLFTKYYSTLSTIDLDEFNVNEKLNYLIQLPADIFFANFFHTLYPEDIKKPIELVYTATQRKNLYFATRSAMYNEGLINMERPAIVMSKDFPRIEIDTQIPHWDMSFSEINQIVSRWRFSLDEIESLYKNVFALQLQELTVSIDGETKNIEAAKAINEILGQSRENIAASTAKNFFQYFQKIKELAKMKDGPKPDFYTIKNKKEVEQIGAILKSKNMVRILWLANGTKTVSELAKAMDMQIANASLYIAKLRKAGLITIKDKKVTRTTRGIKLNFEASLNT